MNHHNNSAKKTKKKKSDRKFLIIAAAVLVVAGGLAAVYRNNSTPKKSGDSSKTAPRPTTDKTTPSVPPTPEDKQPGNTAPPSPAPAAPPPLSDVKPIKPSGTFVSNHTPGQNGSPLEEASICNTSPSVDCVITFTKDGVTKSLPTKRTDSSGVAYWESWTPKSVGLTAGKWTVTAVVTAAHQTDSTSDPASLEILP